MVLQQFESDEKVEYYTYFQLAPTTFIRQEVKNYHAGNKHTQKLKIAV